jgi:hypothetical protein
MDFCDRNDVFRPDNIQIIIKSRYNNIIGIIIKASTIENINGKIQANAPLMDLTQLLLFIPAVPSRILNVPHLAAFIHRHGGISHEINGSNFNLIVFGSTNLVQVYFYFLGA